VRPIRFSSGCWGPRIGAGMVAGRVGAADDAGAGTGRIADAGGRAGSGAAPEWCDECAGMGDATTVAACGSLLATGARAPVMCARWSAAVGVIGRPQTPQNRAPSSISFEQCGQVAIGGSTSR
jgi:hypothetical protein